VSRATLTGDSPCSRGAGVKAASWWPSVKVRSGHLIAVYIMGVHVVGMHLIGVKLRLKVVNCEVWRSGRGFSIDDVGHRRHGQI
jgi:hypothetical protein